MSDRENPDEVIETDDGIALEYDDPADEPLEDGDPDDSGPDSAESDDSDSDGGAIAEDGSDVVEEPEEEPADDELADREANEMLVEEQLHGDESAADSDAPGSGGDALVSRLRLIGRQPLSERAAALHQLHDELRAQLEASDLSRR